MFRRFFGVCPFFNTDKLCSFQCGDHVELMPLVCREFPRQTVDFGAFYEETLLLSCPESAMLFIHHPGRLAFLKKDINIRPFYTIDNDDIPYLDFLRSERDKILDFLWNDEMPLPEAWQDLYAYIRQQHDYEMRNDTRDLVVQVELTTDKSRQGEYAVLTEPSYAFYPIKTIDRMMINHIDYGWLQIREPKLWFFIKRYLKIFSDLPLNGADSWFDSHVRSMIEAHPELELKYRSYFSYNIQQLYPLAYENYFTLRQFLFAVLYTQLLIMFDLIDYMSSSDLSINRQAEILLILEKGVRHNPTQTDNLLNVIRQSFL